MYPFTPKIDKASLKTYPSKCTTKIIVRHDSGERQDEIQIPQVPSNASGPTDSKQPWWLSLQTKPLVDKKNYNSIAISKLQTLDHDLELSSEDQKDPKLVCLSFTFHGFLNPHIEICNIA